MLRLSIALIIVCAASLLSCGEDDVNAPPINDSDPSEWQLRGTSGLLIGGYGDNFVYGGSNVTPITGEISIDVNADVDTGSVTVTFQGLINPESGVTYQGDIRFVVEGFDVVYMPWAPWQEAHSAKPAWPATASP